VVIDGSDEDSDVDSTASKEIEDSDVELGKHVEPQ
jgi:hypothetical protein